MAESTSANFGICFDYEFFPPISWFGCEVVVNNETKSIARQSAVETNNYIFYCLRSASVVCPSRWCNLLLFVCSRLYCGWWFGGADSFQRISSKWNAALSWLGIYVIFGFRFNSSALDMFPWICCTRRHFDLCLAFRLSMKPFHIQINRVRRQSDSRSHSPTTKKRSPHFKMSKYRIFNAREINGQIYWAMCGVAVCFDISYFPSPPEPCSSIMCAEHGNPSTLSSLYSHSHTHTPRAAYIYGPAVDVHCN